MPVIISVLPPAMLRAEHPVPTAALFDKLADSVACYERDGTIVYVNPVTCQIFGRASGELVNRNLWQLFPEAVGNDFYVAFQKVAASGETAHFDNFYAPWARWYENSAYLADQRVWVIARDVTEQRRAAARLEILATTSRAFSQAASDPPTLFDTIARALAEVLHDGCVIRLLSLDGLTFDAPIGVWDRDPEVAAALREAPSARATEGAGAEVLRTGRALILSGVDPAAIAERIAPPERRAFVTDLGIHSVMVVPLTAQGQVLGIVSVFRRLASRVDPFTEGDRQLLEELADRAVLVVTQWRTHRLVELERLKLRRLLAEAPFAVVAYEGPDHVVQFSNPKHEEMTGGRIVVGRPLVESLPELAGKPVMQILHDVYTTAETRTLREFHSPLLRNGSLVDCWYDVTWQAVPDAAGVVTAVLVSAVEVTEHVVARRRLDTVTSNATLGLVMMDARQHCTFMNPAAEALTGYRFQEVQGKPLHYFIHHSHPDGAPYPMEECPIDRALPTKNRETGEDVFVHADGHFYPVAFTASPIVESGTPVGTVVEFRDTTTEKAAERERERLLQELRAAVASRDEFLSIASHELRTPLTALCLQLEGLKRSLAREGSGDRESTTRKVEMALRQTGRLTALIDGLLNVSRIATGRLQLELEEFDVGALVQDVVERFDDQAARARSTLTVSVPAVATGRWDRLRLDQALTNLLSNAVKYGAGAAISVSVSAEDDQVAVTVSDRGIGIATTDFERIFGRFERAVSSNHYGGLGLGLYIAREIVAAHGGSLCVESEPGNGATFTMRLPRYRATQPPASGPASTSETAP